MENTTPFDLENAIRQWRDALAASPSFRRDDVDQLESHLRDAVVHWQEKGLLAREAFWVASNRLGAEKELAGEFAKINAGEVWLDRALWIAIGYFGVTALGGIAGMISNIAALMIWELTGSQELTKIAANVFWVAAFNALLGLAWRGGISGKGLFWLVGAKPLRPMEAGGIVVLAKMGIWLFGSLSTAALFHFMPTPTWFAASNPWPGISIFLWPITLAYVIFRARRAAAKKWASQ